MHIKGLFDKFQGCAWLLTPAEILYGMSDKLQQIHEPTGRNLQKDMIHEVKQCKYLDGMRRGTNRWRGAANGKEWEKRGDRDTRRFGGQQSASQTRSFPK